MRLLGGAWWGAFGREARAVKIAVVICSCFREDITRRKAALLQNGLEPSLPVTIMVVDNGRTLSREDFDPRVRLYPNPNTGGAGGFTRGLIEALESGEGFTHVLFSDDDAFFGPDALRRTLTLLGLARPEYAGARLSGAMMIAERPTVQHASREWRKDRGGPLPRRHSADLADWDQVLRHGVVLRLQCGLFVFY